MSQGWQRLVMARGHANKNAIVMTSTNKTTSEINFMWLSLSNKIRSEFPAKLNLPDACFPTRAETTSLKCSVASPQPVAVTTGCSGTSIFPIIVDLHLALAFCELAQRVIFQKSKSNGRAAKSTTNKDSEYQCVCRGCQHTQPQLLHLNAPILGSSLGGT